MRKLLSLIRKGASERIAAGIARFETLAAQLDAAAAECRAGIEKRYDAIDRLYDEADGLHNDASRGESVDAKLRQLIA